MFGLSRVTGGRDEGPPSRVGLGRVGVASVKMTAHFVPDCGAPDDGQGQTWLKHFNMHREPMMNMNGPGPICSCGLIKSRPTFVGRVCSGFEAKK